MKNIFFILLLSLQYAPIIGSQNTSLSHLRKIPTGYACIWQAECFALGDRVEVTQGMHKGSCGQVIAWCAYCGESVKNCLKYAVQYAGKNMLPLTQIQYEECKQAMQELYGATNPWSIPVHYDPETREIFYPKPYHLVISDRKGRLALSYERQNIVIFVESDKLQGMFHDTMLKNLQYLKKENRFAISARSAFSPYKKK